MILGFKVRRLLGHHKDDKGRLQHDQKLMNANAEQLRGRRTCESKLAVTHVEHANIPNPTSARFVLTV